MDAKTLDEAPTFAGLRTELPAVAMLARDAAAGRRSDLAVLHEAAGRPRGKSPTTYWRKYRTRWDEEDVRRGPGGRLLADWEAALHYLEWTDARVHDATRATHMRSSRMEPSTLAWLSPDPITIRIAREYLECRDDIPPEGSLAALVRGVVADTIGFDGFHRETLVALVQRGGLSLHDLCEAGQP